MGLRIITALLSFLLAACGSLPVTEVESPADAAGIAAGHAQRLVGLPYRPGGANPASGFDCSGLVQFSFRQAGVILPRSTEAQLRASTLVEFSRMRVGDLLVFDQDGLRKSHVGLYLGNGRFVHAPSSGKSVRVDRIESQYWRRHLAEVRRF